MRRLGKPVPRFSGRGCVPLTVNTLRLRIRRDPERLADTDLVVRNPSGPRTWSMRSAKPNKMVRRVQRSNFVNR